MRDADDSRLPSGLPGFWSHAQVELQDPHRLLLVQVIFDVQFQFEVAPVVGSVVVRRRDRQITIVGKRAFEGRFRQGGRPLNTADVIGISRTHTVGNRLWSETGLRFHFESR